jgi:hypothetical protein
MQGDRCRPGLAISEESIAHQPFGGTPHRSRPRAGFDGEARHLSIDHFSRGRWMRPSRGRKHTATSPNRDRPGRATFRGANLHQNMRVSTSLPARTKRRRDVKTLGGGSGAMSPRGICCVAHRRMMNADRLSSLRERSADLPYKLHLKLLKHGVKGGPANGGSAGWPGDAHLAPATATDPILCPPMGQCRHVFLNGSCRITCEFVPIGDPK